MTEGTFWQRCQRVLDRHRAMLIEQDLSTKVVDTLQLEIEQSISTTVDYMLGVLAIHALDDEKEGNGSYVGMIQKCAVALGYENYMETAREEWGEEEDAE